MTDSETPGDDETPDDAQTPGDPEALPADDPDHPAVPDGWPMSTMKIRVNRVRGMLAAQTIAYVSRSVADRDWKVSKFETRETWALLHFPYPRNDDGVNLSPEADLAALADVEGFLGAVKTATLQARQNFVVILDDEEVGTVYKGEFSWELVRDVLEPWRRMLGHP